MPKTALVVGGAGATGRHLVEGLVARGFETTILHRGVHEPAHLAGLRHLHADPHFAESVTQVLGNERFDLVLLTYGRVAQLARVFEQRCQQLLAVGGVPLYPGFADPQAAWPGGMRVLAGEDEAPGDTGRIRAEPARRFVEKMAAAERAVLEAHARGSYRGTVFRYPRIYGPGSIVSQEWSIVKRVQEGRHHLLLPNAGQAVFTRCAAANAAHCVLLAVDRPEAAAGQVFNCGDDQQYSLQQWARIVLDALGADLELVGLPPHLNHVAPQFALYGGTMFGHALASTDKARALLGYRDVMPAAEAIAESARWWRSEGAEQAAAGIQRDAFDYALEDTVRERLEQLARAVPAAVRSTPVHSYPHPKRPGLARDHHGR
ncbi:MAG TPA: NAD-dependent epimerase/dehydratase family protein [Ramlibacter sp.]|nr:NAD-dependent epimerase/dehydratase family protein [Ramlibacter sp.]